MDMKKSLIARFVLIALIVFAWSVVLRPLQDQSFLGEFFKISEKQVVKFEKKVQKNPQAEEKIYLDQYQELLTRIADDMSDIFTKAIAEAESPEVNRPESVATERKFLQTYNEKKAALKEGEMLSIDELRDLITIGADCESVVPQRVLQNAAKGDGQNKYIELFRFIPRYYSRQVSNQQVIRFIRAESRANLRRGLDLEGGVEFVVSYTKLPGTNYSDERLSELVRQILADRVNSSGLADADVQTLSGTNKITITLPAVSQAEKADMRQKILMPAKLEFYEVHADNNALAYACVEDPSKIPFGCTLKFIENEEGNNLTRIPVLLVNHNQCPNDIRELSGSGFNKNAKIIDEAVLGNDPSQGGFLVSITFTPAGAKAFASVTERLKPQGMRERQLAIVLDGRVYSAPNIKGAITGGRCQISGSFSQEEAKILADAIASGNLPATLFIDSMNDSPARLGAENVRQGFFAVTFGLCAILAFTIFYYRLCGIIASIALIINLVLTLGTMAMLGAAITMPGVAGLVLGIGMAVDANVLIYERMRDELSKGKSLPNAVKASFGRVFWPILDANITTLITCYVLYKFGTGPIRGFAITLGFGVCASMFTALTVTRFCFDFLIYNNWLKTVKITQWFPSSLDLKVLRFAKIAIVFSTTLVILSLGTALIRGKDIFGIDFAGGVRLTYEIPQELVQSNAELPNTADIAALLAANPDSFTKGYRLSAVRITYKSGIGSKFLDITMPHYDFSKNSPALQKRIDAGEQFTPSQLEEEKSITKIVSTLLDNKYPKTFIKGSSNEIGNLVGADFQKQALIALGLAALCTVIYIAFRFEFVYGVAAVIAVLHDVTIAAGIFIMFQGQLSLTVLAALLTILGYSLNDTIVIFDRIREELELFPNKSYRRIVEDSVNSMTARTVLTTLTTLIGVASLLVLGGSSLWEFSIVMLYGLLFGTYSTIYIASYIVVCWHKHRRADDIEDAVIKE